MWQERPWGIAPEGEPLVLLLLVAFLFGLVVGSFLNVLIYRIPRRLSIVRPGSQCPHCGARIRPRDNVPLLSFFLLRGRCRSCRQPISWQYPAVELGTALLFVLLVWERGWGWELVPEAFFVSALIALAVIDARHRLLPDALTYPGFVLAVGLRALVPAEPIAGARGLVERPSGNPLSVLRHAVFEHALGAGAVLILMSSALLLLLERVDYRLLGRKLEGLDEAHSPEDEPSAPAPGPAARVEDPRQAIGAGSESPLSSAGIGSGGYPRDAERKDSWSPEWMAIVTAIGLAGAFVLRGLHDPSFALSGVRSALSALEGAVIGSGVLWLSRLGYYALRRLEGVGFGDVKMLLMIGAFLGWGETLLTIFLASLLGSVYGVTLMLLRRERNPTLPFGSFLSLAALVVLLFLP
ncbi:Type 4 prepilin-like proteins leader peptide-processing enzyme [bacterium HR10]|nr:Type 4 prepilin-like proteins leader peptide-processing enzyme [bacterium HR10]